MQKSFEIEQGVPEIWGFKRLEIILLRETKKEEKIPLCSNATAMQEPIEKVQVGRGIPRPLRKIRANSPPLKHTGRTKSRDNITKKQCGRQNFRP